MGDWKEALDFIATTENIGLISTFFSY